jgi:hypothetical protein
MGMVGVEAGCWVGGGGLDMGLLWIAYMTGVHDMGRYGMVYLGWSRTDVSSALVRIGWVVG